MSGSVWSRQRAGGRAAWMFMEPSHSADKRQHTVRGEGEQGLLIKGRAGVLFTLPKGAVASSWRARPVFSPLLEESWV